MLKTKLQLIAEAHSGDQAAMISLITICQPDLYRFARKTCATAEDAEDAVQTAVWIIYKKITMLQHVAAFTQWLFRIIERECYRIFRQKKLLSPLDESTFNEVAANKIPEELGIDLGQAIASLPDIYRSVIILRDIEELTAPEVAQHLAISIAAVKSRLHRARAMVRQYLIDHGYKISE